MMRLLTALVLGCGLAACSSSTAPSAQERGASVTFPSVASLSVKPTSVTFGNQIVNTTSAPIAVTVTNSGSVPQPVSAEINGMPGQWQRFASSSDCPTMLAVGANCTVSITFTPSAGGMWGAYLVVDGIDGEQGVINIGGTGT